MLSFSSEFNLGVDASEFTVLRRVWTKNAQLDLDTLWVILPTSPFIFAPCPGCS